MISPFPSSESRAALTAESARDERVVRLQLGAKAHFTSSQSFSVLAYRKPACYSFQLCMMLLAFLSKQTK